MELAAVEEGGMAFSSSEVSGLTIEVSSPSAFADAGTFHGDKGGNSEGGIHRKVVTPDELLPPFACCD
eukprot:7780755-Ditylum_brightwellii.AAC.1